MNSATEKDQDPVIGNTARSIISLLLTIHLIMLFVFLSGSLVGDYRSDVQARLIGLFNVYGQPLQIETSSRPYYLYSGHPLDNDHIIEVVLSFESGEEEVLFLGTSEDPIFGNSPRLRRYATLLAAFASEEDDTSTAELTKNIGGYVLKKKNAERAVVTCLTHTPQYMDFVVQDGTTAEDPFDDAYFTANYSADVWIAGDGSVQVLKRSSQNQVAPTE